MSETEIVAKTDDKSIGAYLNDPKIMGQFKNALPKHITPERFMRIAVTTINNNPSLLKCTRVSLLRSLVQSAQLGLEPDGILGRAYLIPYGSEVQFQVGYKGLIELAKRSGRVKDIYARIAYKKDTFKVRFGTDEYIEHEPYLDGDPGPIRAVYAVAIFEDGTSTSEVLTLAEVNKVRDSSKASKNGPWVTWYDEMAKKTAIKRLGKRLPLSPEFNRAAEIDERNDMQFEERDITPAEPLASVKAGVQDALSKKAATLAPAAVTVEAEPVQEPEGSEVVDATPAPADETTAQKLARLVIEYHQGDIEAADAMLREHSAFEKDGKQIKGFSLELLQKNAVSDGRVNTTYGKITKFINGEG